MGIVNFIIVLGFNLWWAKDGLDHYVDIYNGNYSSGYSVGAWLYAAWGIGNLIYACL